MISYRLTSETMDTGPVIKETLLPDLLQHGKWQHMIVSYVEELDGSTVVGKVCFCENTKVK